MSVHIHLVRKNFKRSERRRKKERKKERNLQRRFGHDHWHKRRYQDSTKGKKKKERIGNWDLGM